MMKCLHNHLFYWNQAHVRSEPWWVLLMTYMFFQDRVFSSIFVPCVSGTLFPCQCGSFHQSWPPHVIDRPRSKLRQSCHGSLLFNTKLHGLGFSLSPSLLGRQMMSFSKKTGRKFSVTLIFSRWTQNDEARLSGLVSNLSLMTLIRHSYLITGRCRRTHNPKCAFKSTGGLNNAWKISSLVCQPSILEHAEHDSESQERQEQWAVSSTFWI